MTSDESVDGTAAPIRVFISYSHDSHEHDEVVRDFWLFLRGNGFDAKLDLPAAEQRQDWPIWMAHQIRDANFVLVIASPEYKRRAEGDAPPQVGRGGQWEAMFLRDEYYRDRPAALKRILPVVLPGRSTVEIPSWMSPDGATHYLVSQLTLDGADRLIRYMTDQPYEVEPPVTGRVPHRPPRGTATSAPDGTAAAASIRRTGLRTEVTFAAVRASEELRCVTSFAGTVAKEHVAPFPTHLGRVWELLKQPVGLAAEGLAQAGRSLAAALLDRDTEELLARIVTELAIGDGVDFVLEGDEGVLGLPFELMKLRTPDGVGLPPISLMAGVAVRRRVTSASPRTPIGLAGPLKVLAAIAAPDESKTGNSPLDVEAEMGAVLDALNPLTSSGGQVRILEVASLAQIRAAIDAEEFHVLHLSAHGSPGSIELEDEDGAPVSVSTGELIDALKHAGRPVPLIMLSSCSGAAGHGGAMAAGLVRAGADRVIAMQATVSDTYATALAATLYQELDRHPDRPVARALGAARRTVEERLSAERPGLRLPEFAVATLMTAGGDAPLLDLSVPATPLSIASEQVQTPSVRDLPIGYLIGRRPQLRDVISMLSRTPAALNRYGQVGGVLLSGPGGIGKTAITGRAIARLRDRGWAIAIHDGQWNPRNLFQAVVDALNVTGRAGRADPKLVATLHDNQIDDLQKVQALGQLLRGARLVVVFDDFEQNLTEGGQKFRDETGRDIIATLTNAADVGAVLFTCRYPLPSSVIDVVNISVPPLSPAELRRMFMRLPALSALDADDQRLLTSTIGGHPRLIEFVDALLREGRSNLRHIKDKLRQLAHDEGIDLTEPRQLAEAVVDSMRLGAANILLEDLLTLVGQDTPIRVLRQIAVSRAPMSVADLTFALESPDVSVPDLTALRRILHKLASLTLIGLDGAGDDLVIQTLPWIAETLEKLLGPDLRYEHERALAMRSHRLETGRAKYEDFVDIPRHHSRLQRFEEVVRFAEQAVQAIGTTLGVAAYLSELRLLIPDSDREWLLLNDLEQQNFIRVGQLTVAKRLAEQSFGIVRASAEADPENVGRQYDLTVSHDRLGDLAVAGGDLTTARTAFTAALTIRQRHADTNPHNTEWQRQLSVSHNKLGDVAVAGGDLTAARSAFSSALTIRQRLADTNPHNTEWQRDLSISHDRLGDVTVAVGDLTTARTAFTAALTIRQRLADTDPHNAQWQRDLSISHNKLGDLAMAVGDLTTARTAFTADLTIAQRLADTDPHNTQWQRDLSIAHNKLGELALAAGDATAPRTAFTAALTIAQRLADTDPHNTEWQRDLSISHNKLGYLAMAEGDPTAARTAFIAALTIRERLTDTDPNNTQWQRDMSISHIRLGELAVADGDLTAARTAFTAGLTITQRLADLDPSNAQWQRDLGAVQGRLNRLDAEPPPTAD